MTTQETPSKTNDENFRDERGLIHRFWRHANSTFPSIIPPPPYRPNLDVWRRQDNEENEKTSPPTDESIDLLGIWAVEFYTPSFVEPLLSSISRLKWDRVERSWFDPDMRTSIRRARETPFGGSWHNLGIIAPAHKRYLQPHLPAQLPPAFEYALGGLFTLTPSITAIVLGFFTDDQGAKCFEQALRRRYQTHAERRGRNYRLHNPENQKRQAMREIRSELRAGVTSWFRAHIPGLFSSGHLGDDVPTCEVVTLRVAQPFPVGPSRSGPILSYLDLLEMAHGFEAWQWKDHSGVRFSWPQLLNTTARYHAIVAANDGAVDADQLRSYGGPNRSAYFQLLDAHLQPLISRWALLPLISGLEHHLSSVRDSANFGAASRKSISLFDKLSTRIHQSVDISAVAEELRNFGRQRIDFSHNVESFHLVDPSRSPDREITLAKALRLEVVARARVLDKADHSARELIVQYGALLSARENLRLQQRIGMLTWVLVVLTVAIAVLTAALAWDVVKRLSAWLQG